MGYDLGENVLFDCDTAPLTRRAEARMVVNSLILNDFFLATDCESEGVCVTLIDASRVDEARAGGRPRGESAARVLIKESD